MRTAPFGDYCRQLMGFNGAGKVFVVGMLFGDQFGKISVCWLEKCLSLI